MARKRTPGTSRITRAATLAYARKQKPSGDGEDKAEGEAPKEKDEKVEAKAAEAKPAEAKPPEAKPDVTAEAKPAEAKPDVTAEAKPAEAKPAEAKPPEPKPPEPEPEPAPPPAMPRTTTAAMPADVPVGAPPAVPPPSSAAIKLPADAGTVEEPASMPGPRDIPDGDPQDPAAAPGSVPRGDSRSLRRQHEFVLVYRVGTYVISRTGVVGTRGVWRVVEYPTSAAASHAYAKECSRRASEGFSDYRA